MKITRQKHAKKHLGFFRNNFGVREPYQILLDGTFCQAALRGRIQLREQLPRYLMGETQLCTTREQCQKPLMKHFPLRQQWQYLKTMKHLLSPFVPPSFFLILIAP
ncbi:UTP23 isoform 6 [Pan troglodytes]|uniref:UTP23 small subunit processome component n=3 Tax=Pan TaxID=9596 RepID=A0A2I3T1Q1_PANTR|nr:UTP23 isoform 6 [Pan troglodytes]